MPDPLSTAIVIVFCTLLGGLVLLGPLYIAAARDEEEISEQEDEVVAEIDGPPYVRKP